MSKTDTVFIQGKLSWVKCQTPDEWGKWKATVHPTPASLEKVRDLQAEGLKNVIKKDDDGYYVSFSRPTQKMIKGKVVGLAPPEILQPDGTNPDGSKKTKPLTGVIVGNGSDGVLKLEVYSHGTPGGGKAKAARLQSVIVTELIPFEIKRDFTPEQQEAVAGLDSQTEEPW